MKARGFTLIEVMIALAIVALSVGALLGTVTSSASNIIYLKEKTLAEWVALNRITEIRIGQQMPDKGKRTGNAEMGGMRWQWEEEVIELPVKGMFRVEVHARPTGEFIDDRRVTSQPASQTAARTSAAGSDLDKVAWTSTATGVVGTAQSARRDAIASPYSGDTQARGPNNPGGPGGTPKTPGTTDR